jgi:hypothetical protein
MKVPSGAGQPLAFTGKDVKSTRLKTFFARRAMFAVSALASGEASPAALVAVHHSRAKSAAAALLPLSKTVKPLSFDEPSTREKKVGSHPCCGWRGIAKPTSSPAKALNVVLARRCASARDVKLSATAAQSRTRNMALVPRCAVSGWPLAF